MRFYRMQIFRYLYILLTYFLDIGYFQSFNTRLLFIQFNGVNIY